jgi:hypothetical protein
MSTGNADNFPVVQGESGPAIIDRATGELIPLTDAPDDALASLRDYLKDLRSRIAEANALLDSEVVRRMDQDRCWTIHAGGLTLTAPSPAPAFEWDAPGLYSDLEAMVADGELSERAFLAAVDEVVGYRVKAAGVNALLKGGGPVAEIVKAHRTEVEKPRRVSVKRAA